MTAQLPLTIPPERWFEAGPWYRYFAALVVAQGQVDGRAYRAVRGLMACRVRWFNRIGRAGAWFVPGGDVLAHCRAVVEATE